jgi:NAD-dependent DNA ligase
MAKPTLTDIPGIGPATAADLRKAGFRTLESLAKASAGAVEAVQGFGAVRAARIKKAAGALARSAATTVQKAASPKPVKAEPKTEKKGGKKKGDKKSKQGKPKKDKPPKGKKKDKKKKDKKKRKKK